MENLDTTQIINLEIKSLQDLKNIIKDCQNQMAGLSSESEKYKQLSKESSEAQSKYNQVLADSKYNTDEAANSYNALAQEMAKLKKEWKETGDAAEQVKLGERIKEINDKLKEMDASIGNYQRNVGNYGGAFEEAFKAMAPQITKNNTLLNGVAGNVTRMIPLIKKVNQTATAGLSGIKKAIASTGIGLLVVALGTIVAYWDDIKKAAVDFLGIEDKNVAATKRHADEMERIANAAKQTNDEMAYQKSLALAQGQSEIEVLDNQIAAYQKLSDEVNKKKWAKKDWISLYEDAAGVSKATIKQKEEEIEALEKLEAEYDAEVTKLTQQRTIAVENQKRTDKEQAEAIAKAAEEANKTEIERLKNKYETEKALLEKQGLDTVELTKKYQSDLDNIRKKGVSKSDPLAEASKREADSIAERARKSQLTELEILDETYAKEKDKLKERNADLLNLEKEYQEKRQNIIEKEANKRIDDGTKNLDKKASIDTFDAENANYVGTEVQQEQAKAEAIYAINKKLIEDKISLLQQEVSAFTEGSEERMAIETKVSDYKEQLRQLNIEKDNADADLQKNLLEEAKQAQLEAFEEQQVRIEKIFDTINKYNDELSSTFSNLSSMVESMIDIEQKSGKATEQSSKKKQKALKALKALETTVAVASIATNAAQSIMSIWQGYASETATVNVESAAATGPLAVATKAGFDAKSLASAIARTAMIGTTATASIASAIAGTVSSIKGMSTSSMSNTVATPIASEYKPNYTANLTNQSDTDNLANAMTKANIWVSVTDINEAQVKVSQRDNESTF